MRHDLLRLTEPPDHGYAQAGRRGTWIQVGPPGACPECGSPRSKRAQPLVMEWEPGSDVVGDFTLPGFDSEVVVNEAVGRALQERFTGFELGAVDMVDTTRRVTGSREARRVRLPYEGPKLFEIWVTRWVHLDSSASTARLLSTCRICGTAQYELTGAERWETSWDPKQRQLLRAHTPRVPGKGLYVRDRELEQDSIFRIHEFPSWVFCTADVREFVLGNGFNNVAFIEMGSLLPG